MMIPDGEIVLVAPGTLYLDPLLSIVELVISSCTVWDPDEKMYVPEYTILADNKVITTRFAFKDIRRNITEFLP
jgi:hypothetical protein